MLTAFESTPIRENMLIPSLPNYSKFARKQVVSALESVCCCLGSAFAVFRLISYFVSYLDTTLHDLSIFFQTHKHELNADIGLAFVHFLKLQMEVLTENPKGSRLDSMSYNKHETGESVERRIENSQPSDNTQHLNASMHGKDGVDKELTETRSRCDPAKDRYAKLNLTACVLCVWLSWSTLVADNWHL